MQTQDQRSVPAAQDVDQGAPPSRPRPIEMAPPPEEQLADPHRLARFVRERYGSDPERRLTLRHWGRAWWRYSDGRYQILDDEDLVAAVTHAVKHEFDTRPVTNRWGQVRQVTRGLVTNVVNALRSFPEIRVPADVMQPAWLGDAPEGREYIAMQNGLLDVRAFLGRHPDVLQPHTPEWFTPACLPYVYEPSATCQPWTGFLDWMFKGDEEVIALVQEWFGYCLVMDSSQQRFVIAVGDGANGKKVLLDTLEGLVGKENCSAVALEDFGGRFDLAATVGKLVNVCSEVGDVTTLPEGKLKAFVAGDLMTFDRKHRKPLLVNPTARLVFATNHMPKFADRSEGIWRRLIQLPCQVTIAHDQQDRSLSSKMREELPGILNWALRGLDRLRQRKEFHIPAVCLQASEEHRDESNPERQFFEERCVRERAASEECRLLYNAYTGWCQDNSYRPMDARQFGRALRRQFPHVERKRRTIDGLQVWAYLGVREA